MPDEVSEEARPLNPREQRIFREGVVAGMRLLADAGLLAPRPPQQPLLTASEPAPILTVGAARVPQPEGPGPVAPPDDE